MGTVDYYVLSQVFVLLLSTLSGIFQIIVLKFLLLKIVFLISVSALTGSSPIIILGLVIAQLCKNDIACF